MYQFSKLFGCAWLKAMTPRNIISGFEVTGVYPKIDIISFLLRLLNLHCQIRVHFIPLLTSIRNSERPSVSATSSPNPRSKSDCSGCMSQMPCDQLITHNEQMTPDQQWTHKKQTASDQQRTHEKQMTPDQQWTCEKQMAPDQWRTRVKQTAPDQQRTCEKQTAPDQQSAQFSAEEIVKFKKRMEEHFDITSDERYNLWLS